ncbi:MAG: hypothetical protein NC212_09150 [Staphylococcus sp.]|nr:hypothetical protein [Staphylococcus sp.]
MIDIAQHIEYLLLHHDCVVVPGLGAFMLNHECASFDASSLCFMPPALTVGFNPEVKHNDAMLIGSISRRHAVSLETAKAEMNTAVASIHHQLGLTGEISFGNLGTLSSGSTPDCPVFTPSTDSLPVRKLTGFRPLEVAPLCVDADDEVVNLESTTGFAVIPTPLKIVASFIAVMIAFGILYSTTSLVDRGRMNFASLDTGLSSHLEQTISIDTPSIIGLSREILLNIAFPADSKEAPDASVTKEVGSTAKDSGAAKTSDIPGRYILVVGSFPNHQAAERHICNVGDTSLKIIEMDGNYRIYAASASNINDARRLSESLQSKYSSVWICRR